MTPGDLGRLSVVERKTRSGKHRKFELHAYALSGRRRIGIIYQIEDGEEGVEKSRAIALKLAQLWNADL